VPLISALAPIAAALACLMSSPTPAVADEADFIFDDTRVLTYELTFAQPDWWDSLTVYFETYDDVPYLPATFTFEGQVLDSIGVRFKGNSSYWGHPGVKKPFKIKFDKFDENQLFYGLKKTNLNNSFKDPTMLREEIFLDLLRNRQMPAMRANHVRLLINGELWGLYVQVEQVDKIFFQGYLGGAEDGNLFKGDPHGTLEWLGPDPDPYKQNYELKTNEEKDDWSDLIHLIDVLNHTPPENLQEDFAAVFEVPVFLEFLAANNLFVNLDAYVGTGHNYYVYHCQATDRFLHYPWDCNEAFGVFNFGMNLNQIQSLDPFWLPPLQWGRRPLCERVWSVFDWQRSYLRHIAATLREDFTTENLYPRIDELADLIRPYVYEDPNKMYSNEDFEANLEHAIWPAPHTIPGFKDFIQARISYMDPWLDQFSSRSDLRLNELQSVNAATITDEYGDYDPWIEIYNLGPGLVHIQTVYLTDNPGEPFLWELPIGDLDDGRFLLLWMDGETGEGANHASFTLDPAGGTLQLYKSNGGSPELIDEISYPALEPDVSYGRNPDGEGDWELMHTPTPEEPNTPDSLVFDGICVNEFLASNDTVLPDEYGEYDDWVEIAHLGSQAVSLVGWGLTDDLSDPFKWTFPETTLAVGTYLIVWFDDDPEQGPLHTPFKLSASGEQIGLFLPDGTPVDTLTFGEQTTDISMGRYPDGADEWVFFDEPTPGAPNVEGSGVPDGPGAPEALEMDWSVRIYPVPLRGNALTILLGSGQSVQDGRNALGAGSALRGAGIYDLQGRRVRDLLQTLAGGDVGSAGGSPRSSGTSGELRLSWNGRDESGRAVTGGVYFLRLDGAAGPMMRKLILVQ
jgi:hypothetical protein